MSRRGLYPLVAGVCILIVCVMLGSWIANLYEQPVKSMLSAEGIRWMVAHVMTNVDESPWMGLFLVVGGIGLLHSSGMFQSLVHYVHSFGQPFAFSRKKRQALILSLVFLCLYVALLWIVTFSRWQMLLGITGTLERSPFLRGAPFLLGLGLGLTGIIYGLCSGRFRRMSDCVDSMAAQLSSMLDYFIYLFGCVQLLGIFHYSGMDAWLGLSSPLFAVISYLLYYMPFVIALCVRLRSS